MSKVISYKRLTHYWPLYFFVLPSALLVATFAYFPAVSAFYHAFYRWDGDTINIFIGMAHFRKALGTPWYWGVAFLMLIVFMAVGRKQTKKSYVVMALAGIVSPLISAVTLVSIGEAFVGIEAPAGSVALAVVLWLLPAGLTLLLMNNESENKPLLVMVLGLLGLGESLKALGLTAVFAYTVTIIGIGLFLWLAPFSRGWIRLYPMKLIQTFTAMGFIFWALGAHAGGDATLWSGFTIISILVVANIVKLTPSIATAVAIHRLRSDAANYWYRVLFVVPMIIPGMVYLLIWKFFFEPNGIFNMILDNTGIMAILSQLDQWLGWGGVFSSGKPPPWLGDPKLVLPAFILWGFPWVNIVGVLIYLAGLQSISNSVYEAADLDGVGPFGKFKFIEFPLIMTQVRINLVMLIIGTFQMYGFILILFGDSGGPNGKMMVPDLWMFRNAFTSGQAGYACCIGLIIFAFILVLSELNNRYVRVEK